MNYRNGTPVRPEHVPTDARKFTPRREPRRYYYLTAREWLRAGALVALVGPVLYLALVMLMLGGQALLDLLGAP